RDRVTGARVEHAFLELHRRLIVHCVSSLLNRLRRAPLLHRFDDIAWREMILRRVSLDTLCLRIPDVRHPPVISRISMRRTFVKWLFATYLLGSGIVWSILILPLFPFVGRNGRYRLATLWCRAV